MSQFSDELKARADIAALIGEYVGLQRRGDRWVGLCPFHQEKTPSFHVLPARQFYYCFGCHAHGDVFRFFMELQKLPFPEAVAWVAEKMQVPLPRASGGEESGQRAALLRINELTADFFARQLRANTGTAGRSYLTGRGVSDAAIERFRLGWANEDGRALTHFLRARDDASAADALAAGVCIQRRESLLRRERSTTAGTGSIDWDDLYDRFRGRVMFPISNENGKVIAFGGRSLAPDPAKGIPKYLNSPETPIYTKGHVIYNLHRAREAIRKLGYFILVEGYLDCLSVFMAGFENVVAACGTALTSSQVERLVRYSRNAVLNLDPDVAGTSATEKHVAALLAEDFQIRVASLPAGLDPDEFVRRHGSDGYRERLGASLPYFDFLLAQARQKFDVRRPEGKSAALQFLLPYLNRLHDPVVRVEMLDKVADQLRLENQLVRQQFKHAARQRTSKIENAAGGSDLLSAERVLLRAWMDWDDQRAALTEVIVGERLLEGLASAQLFDSLAAMVGQTLDLASVTEQLAPPDRELVARILVDDGVELADAEISGAITALRERAVDGRRRELRRQIEAAGKSGEGEHLKQLLAALRDVDAQLARLRAEFQIRAQRAL